jgi:hypothetical protein
VHWRRPGYGHGGGAALKAYGAAKNAKDDKQITVALFSVDRHHLKWGIPTKSII